MSPLHVLGCVRYLYTKCFVVSFAAYGQMVPVELRCIFTARFIILLKREAQMASVILELICLATFQDVLSNYR